MLLVQNKGRYPALGHFSFSNFFKLLFAEMKNNKNNGLKERLLNYVWKFSFRFILILLHIKSAFKKIWHLAQGRVLELCLGPYICISINTTPEIFFSFNQCCLFIKRKVEARTTLFMQKYLFNFEIQGNLWMICNFWFWQENKLLFTIKL